MRHPLILALGLLAASATVHAALEGRDLDGTSATAEAYYDTVLGITWLANVNYFQTSGADADGRGQLGVLQNWTNNLTLGGYLNWRLPRATPADGVDWDVATLTYDGLSSDIGYNHASAGNELGYMFYVNLGNQGAFDLAGAPTACHPNTCLVNAGPFVNLMPEQYYTASPAWFVPYFRMFDGGQYGDNGIAEYRAWAVHDGDIGVAVVVPEPGTWALMLAGVAALSGVARRRR